LKSSSLGLFLGCGGTFLFRLGQILESSLLFEPGDSFGACLEIELERPLDRDLPETEMRRRKYLDEFTLFK